MQIISASRRTDIPAFYSAWLLNRLRAGFCHWMNPFGGQVHRVSLRPEDVLAIVFWTRNPLPLLPHLAALRDGGYRFYFHVTIVGYGRPLETHSPPLAMAIATFQRLSALISPELTLWHYDPIVLSETTPPSYHLQQFAQISHRLQGYTRRCYISFVDMYGKTARNLKCSGLAVREPSQVEQQALVQEMQQIAEQRGIGLYACCEAVLVSEGVQQAHCVDRGLVGIARGDQPPSVRSAPSRPGCGCVQSVDIGAYNTCIYGCMYCYAVNSRRSALQRMREHDPNDSILWRPPRLRGVDLTRLEETTEEHR